MSSNLFIRIAAFLWFLSYFIHKNLIFEVILSIILIYSLFHIKYSLKDYDIKGESILFFHTIEIHIGNKAKGNQKQFLKLVAYDLLWAFEKKEELKINQIVFYTWYKNKKYYQRVLGEKSRITTPNIFEKYANFYNNKYFRDYTNTYSNAKMYKIVIPLRTTLHCNGLEERDIHTIKNKLSYLKIDDLEN